MDTKQKQPIYVVLPKLLRDAGLNIRVTSGYRPPGRAGKAGKKSWHWRHGAVDIVPQGNTTFEDIEEVLYNNPTIKQYLLENGFGVLDETDRTPESRATMKQTGATGPHLHIGRDTDVAAAYKQKVGGTTVDYTPTYSSKEITTEVTSPSNVYLPFFEYSDDTRSYHDTGDYDESLLNYRVESPVNDDFMDLVTRLHPSVKDNKLLLKMLEPLADVYELNNGRYYG